MRVIILIILIILTVAFVIVSVSGVLLAVTHDSGGRGKPLAVKQRTVERDGSGEIRSFTSKAFSKITIGRMHCELRKLSKTVTGRT